MIKPKMCGTRLDLFICLLLFLNWWPIISRFLCVLILQSKRFLGFNIANFLEGSLQMKAKAAVLTCCKKWFLCFNNNYVFFSITMWNINGLFFTQKQKSLWRSVMLYKLVVVFFHFCDWTYFFSCLKIKEPKKIGKLHSRDVFCPLTENRPCKSLFIILTIKWN